MSNRRVVVEIERMARQLRWVGCEEGMDPSIRDTANESADALEAVAELLPCAHELVCAASLSDNLPVLLGASHTLAAMKKLREAVDHEHQ